MIKEPKCYSCKNYINNEESIIPICKAYPKGIPLEIFREEVEHTKEYEGDNGVMYEEDEIKIKDFVDIKI